MQGYCVSYTILWAMPAYSSVKVLEDSQGSDTQFNCHDQGRRGFGFS